ncbi:MAG: NERD domain-containing protein [Nocardioides sp.]
MPKLIPAEPAFVTPSERLVWERLRDGLGDDDVVLSNLRLVGPDRDYEIDFVVLMPEVGILALEVKGGSVWYDDGWIQSSKGESKWIDPVAQVIENKYAARAFVEADRRWSRGHLGWSHGVVTPFSNFPDHFSVPDLPRNALHDRDDTHHLAARVKDNALSQQANYPRPTRDEVEAVAEILAGRMSTAYDVNAEAAEREGEADRLTAQQAMILSVTRLINRVEVRGGAGSGKTVLALQQAKELTRGRSDRPAQRVALLCYSIGLAEHLKRTTAGWGRKEKPAFVGTFEEFGRQWGAPEGSREDSDFWESVLPRTMSTLADDLPDGRRYDSIVVDEAQDFADSWWTPLLKSLRSEDGGLYIFSDENQRIFARYGQPPVALVPLVLDHNLRNTRQIHECFGPLAPSRMYSSGVAGPTVRFVPCAVEDAEDIADAEVERLLDDEGWEPGRVALITTGSRHFSQKHLQDTLGQEGYWSTYFDGDEIFYGHVLGCKGLERSAVVLCLNEDGSRDRARERLYVGMSRATDQLVVVGDPEMVMQVGGREVAKRLGLL